MHYRIHGLSLRTNRFCLPRSRRQRNRFRNPTCRLRVQSCGREDSNLHGIAPNRPSTCSVYHSATAALYRWVGLCTNNTELFSADYYLLPAPSRVPLILATIYWSSLMPCPFLWHRLTPALGGAFSNKRSCTPHYDFTRVIVRNRM